MTLSIHFTARTAAAAALIAALCGAAGCSADSGESEPARTGAAGAETTQPSRTPSGSQSVPEKVEKAAASTRKAVDALAAKRPSPTTKQMLAALTSAGFDAHRVEATRSSTPLKNDVPSVMYGIAVGSSSCIVGEIRQGVATVTVTDRVESGKRCLVGAVETPGS